MPFKRSCENSTSIFSAFFLKFTDSKGIYNYNIKCSLNNENDSFNFSKIVFPKGMK